MNRDPLEVLAQRQIELEQDYRTRSLVRSRRVAQDTIDGGRMSELPPVRKLIAASYDTVVERLEALKREKVAGVGGKYRGFFRSISTDVLAVMGLTITVNSLVMSGGKSHSASAGDLMGRLGRQVQSELLLMQLRAHAPGYMHRVEQYLEEQHTTSPSHILKTLRASAENVHFEHTPWPNSQCISVGRLLLECVWATGLFEWEKSGAGKRSMSYLVAAPHVAEFVQELITEADTFNSKPPMLVPPCKHTTLFDGGYLTELDRRGTYRNNQIHRKDLRLVADAFKNATGLLKALNKAQEVPYRINSTLLELVQQARRLGVRTGMPSSVPAAKPVWYLDGIPKETYDERQLDQFKEWKLHMRNWYANDKSRMSQLRSLVTLCEMAEEFKHEEALYFPTCVDWRYRLYFKSSLHPQGSDLQKALLQFGRAKPLGARGLFWLKVHVATCYGYDKALFEERAAWVDSNIEQVRHVAQSPFDADAFSSADSPWCFLAACIDLVAALDSDNPELYESAVPVAMDATNSGGQHFSGILRDPVGGKLTNLFWTGNPEKADLYMDVKQRTDSKVIMDMDRLEHVVQSAYWREHEVTRSMTKRPTMTYFYSATVRSCSDYIVQGAHEEGYEGTEEYSLTALSSYLAKHMRAAIDEANPAAAACMQYLQDLTRRVPRSHDLRWKSPLGGLVINRYTESEECNVRVNSMNLTMLLAYNMNYNVCNRRKATSGIAPNFVHSLDSTHLMMVINAFDGDIVPIHDSMATHAADVDGMQQCIREEFVRLYEENDVLEVIREAAVQAGADVEDLERPVQGTLNLKQVLTSPFFFC